MHLGGLGLPPDPLRPREGDAQAGMLLNDLDRQGFKPTQDLIGPAPVNDLLPVLQDYFNGIIHRPGLQGMIQAVVHPAGLLVPLGRSQVQLGNRFSALAFQVHLQHLSKEMMVAVPGAFGIQWDQKQILVHQRRQNRRAIRVACYGAGTAARTTASR